MEVTLYDDHILAKSSMLAFFFFLFFNLLFNCSGLMIKWLLFCPSMSWENIWFTSLSTQSIDRFSECLMTLLSDSHAFIAPNMPRDCHLLGGGGGQRGRESSKPEGRLGYQAEYLQSAHLIAFPGCRRPLRNKIESFGLLSNDLPTMTAVTVSSTKAFRKR